MQHNIILLLAISSFRHLGLMVHINVVIKILKFHSKIRNLIRRKTRFHSKISVSSHVNELLRKLRL